jgi:hypothetical protein
MAAYDYDSILKEMLGLLEEENVLVRKDRGEFRSGLVKYYNDRIFCLNRKLSSKINIGLIFKELTELGISQESLSEAAKKLLQEYVDFSNLEEAGSYEV